MKRKSRGINLNVHFSNRWLYTLIALLIVSIVGVGVWGYANPTTGVGHELNEINLPACTSGQVLGINSSSIWGCITPAISDFTETDPRLPSCSANQVIIWVNGAWSCGSDEGIWRDSGTNIGEDIAITITSGNPPYTGIDTCNGDINNYYTCGVLEDRPCIDRASFSRIDRTCIKQQLRTRY